MSKRGATQAPSLESMTRGQLVAEYRDVKADIQALQDAGGENLDDLTPEQITDLETLIEYRDAIKALVQAAPSPKAIKAAIGDDDRPRRPHPGTRGTRGDNPKASEPDPDDDDPAVKARIDVIEDEDDKYLAHGGEFKSLGHFAHAVKAAGDRPGHVRDEGSVLGRWNGRLKRVEMAIKARTDDGDLKAITGMGEFLDSEGAAFVPPTVSKQIWERRADEFDLLSLVDVTPVAGNGFELPAWNDKSKSGNAVYGGAEAYWGAEGSQMTGSKPTTRRISLKLNKLYVLMYATEELLEDTTALDARLTRIAAMAFRNKINDAMINGTGAGQPLGIINAANPAKITVTAESGQGASTVVAKNILKMYKRRPFGANGRLLWLYNRSVESELDTMYLATGSNSGSLVYMTPSGLSGKSYSTMKSERMVEFEHMPALGTEGDITLFDPTSYAVIVKSSGIKQSVSMHLRFDYDEAAFKWTLRIDGRPLWDAPMTPTKGETVAPVVTLSGTRT